MSTRLPRPTGLALAALFVAATAAMACNTLLGLGEYKVGTSTDAGAPFDAQEQQEEPDAATSATDAAVTSDAPNCDADPLTFTDATQCYACTPTTSPQFANACTSSACVPFDETRLTNLLADGALPPVPPKDAASE